MKKTVWTNWVVVTLAIGSYYAHTMFVSEDKTEFLIGDSSYGHYQIELACGTCHTDAFGGQEALQEACVDCHQQELDAVNDSHPKAKFTNPRNADRVAILDARYCITCHTEHRRESTLAMGVTLPEDFCFHCHTEIGAERPSHKDLEYDTCATSGCHNFHDNRALYEDFLVEHANEKWLLQEAAVAIINRSVAGNTALQLADMDAPSEYINDGVAEEWLNSTHSKAGVNCSGCHVERQFQNQLADDAVPVSQKEWIAKPGLHQCQQCHAGQAQNFVEGKHGMRLSAKLSNQLGPMTPARSENLAFHREALAKNQGCATCHQSHGFNTQNAAAGACLSCHNDNHSQSYVKSPHAYLWQREVDGLLAPGRGVSCATCHMPRETHFRNGQKVVQVQHNQNANLRPNEKMIRSVCMNCHGLAFTIDSLADPELINNNFNSKPKVHINSIEMALDRLEPDERAR